MNTARNAAPAILRWSRLIQVSCLLLTAAAGGCRRAETPDPAAAAPVREKSDPPARTITDAAKVFQTAFWRRPAAGDEILGAERREWSDENGLTKWQWFIAVRPSPGLLKYLREDNAFGLAKAGAAAPADGAPAWFRGHASGGSVMRSRTSNLQIVFSDPDNTIYATSTGGGLLPGAPERSTPEPLKTASAGRLPQTPPPVPQPSTP